jgi:hypothetical protein
MMSRGGAALALVCIAAGAAVSACASGGDSASEGPESPRIDGRWQKIGESVRPGNIVPQKVDGQWESVVIYEDGKLTTDDSCTGESEPAGDAGWRLTFNCALGNAICDGELMSDVKKQVEYPDANGDLQTGHHTFGEALKLTCPDDDTYVFVREQDVPPTDASLTPSGS